MSKDQDPTPASRIPPDCPAGTEIAAQGVGGPGQTGEAIPRDGAAPADDPGARVLAIVEERLPALEKKERVERARRGRRSRVEHGFLGGGLPPYALVRVLIDTDTRAVLRVLAPGERARLRGTRASLRQGPVEQVAVVRALFDGIEAGGSVVALTDWLNTRRVPPPRSASQGHTAASTDGAARWNRSTVTGILRNEIYAGVMIFGRTRGGALAAAAAAGSAGGAVAGAAGDPGHQDSAPIRVEGFYPDPPISREQFARVQERLAARTLLYAETRRARGDGGGE